MMCRSMNSRTTAAANLLRFSDVSLLVHFVLRIMSSRIEKRSSAARDPRPSGTAGVRGTHARGSDFAHRRVQHDGYAGCQSTAGPVSVIRFVLLLGALVSALTYPKLRPPVFRLV